MLYITYNNEKSAQRDANTARWLYSAALLTAALTRQAAAAVSVGTYSAWESASTLRLLGGARGAWVPMGEERGGAYCVATHTACYIGNVSLTKWTECLHLQLISAKYLFCLESLVSFC